MKIRSGVLLRSLPLILLCLFLSGCAAIPVSDEELDRAGAQIHQGMLDEYGEYLDPKFDSYVVSVGRRVEAYSDYNGPPLTFTVLDTPIVNAFSVPGGYIHVTRGLAARCNSEAELAYVIGHEIGHLTARHAAQRLSQIRTSMFLSNILGIAAAQYTKDSNLGGMVSSFVDFSSVLMILSYGRDAEFQADSLGIKYAYDAGYDPKAGMAFLMTLEKMEKDEGERSSLSYILATHPPTSDRVDEAKTEVRDLATPESRGITPEVGRADLLKRLDGIVLGESLESGKVSREVYYNRAYDFKLKKEPGYIMAKARSFLVGLYKERTAIFLVYARRASSEALADHAAKLIKSQIDDENYRPKFVHTNVLGNKGLRLDERDRNIRAKFFSRNGVHYSFLFNFNPGVLTDFDGVFAKLINDFSFLTREEASSIVEERMGIYSARAADTPDGIAVKFYGDAKYSGKLLSYNGLGSIKPAELLKIPTKDFLEEGKKK